MTSETHEPTTRQAPGWWPALVRATCSCGWTGPVRDTNNDRERLLLRLDHGDHVRELEPEREEYDDAHPDNWEGVGLWVDTERWER